MDSSKKKEEIENLKIENYNLTLNIEEIQEENLRIFEILQREKNISKLNDNHIKYLIGKLPLK